jgi:hypothetical protein
VSRCPNCRTALAGKFCHECSQQATLHVPSAREFLHEFIGHYVALEGKLWKSLCLLLFRPGRLTREYVEGRRVRYVQPPAPAAATASICCSRCTATPSHSSC